jgi:cob(I)alamin adenosyltransferase
MIQVYTGKGKGKTTASFGLALRAIGAGQKVYIGQFIKCSPSSEVRALKKFKSVKIEQFGCGFIKKNPGINDILMAQGGLRSAIKALKSGAYDMVILDEINVALKAGLLKLEDLLRLVKVTPKKTELIFTGRHAHPEVLKKADLVSHILEKKHYFRKGVKARKGIEH